MYIPIEALHPDEKHLAALREVAAAIPVVAVNVGDGSRGQLLGELGSAARLVFPKLALLVVGALLGRDGVSFVLASIQASVCIHTYTMT